MRLENRLEPEIQKKKILKWVVIEVMMKTIGDEEVCYLNAWHELCRYHLPEIQNVTFPFASRKKINCVRNFQDMKIPC